jgi:hypothetical protein
MVPWAPTSQARSPGEIGVGTRLYPRWFDRSNRLNFQIICLNVPGNQGCNFGLS